MSTGGLCSSEISQASAAITESSGGQKGLVVLIGASAAVLVTLVESLAELLPKVKTYEISPFRLLNEVLWRVGFAVGQAGGLGIGLALLEEFAPKLTTVAGPLAILVSVSVTAISCWRQKEKGLITKIELMSNILQSLVANGGGFVGASIGAALGAPLGPLGVLIGGCVGGYCLATVGSWVADLFIRMLSHWNKCTPTHQLIATLTISYADCPSFPERPDIPLDKDTAGTILQAVEGGWFWGSKTDPVELDKRIDGIYRVLNKHMRQFALRWHPDKNRGDEEKAALMFVAGCSNAKRLKQLIENRLCYHVQEARAGKARAEVETAQVKNENQKVVRANADLEARNQRMQAEMAQQAKQVEAEKQRVARTTADLEAQNQTMQATMAKQAEQLANMQRRLLASETASEGER